LAFPLATLSSTRLSETGIGYVALVPNRPMPKFLP
jgi:hypothetical protein